MHVIAKRSFLFVNHGAPKRQKHTLAASPAPQEVPDWVRELPAYKAALEKNELREVEFVNPGTADVDRAVSFLESRGYKIITPDAGENGDPEKIDERHVAFLKSAGYKAETVEEAEKLIKKMSKKERAGFFEDFCTEAHK